MRGMKIHFHKFAFCGILAILFFSMLTGCATGEVETSAAATVKYNGSGEAVFTIKGDGLSEAGIKVAFSEKINYYNKSEDVKRLTLKSVKKSGGDFIVTVKFKHIGRIYRSSKLTGNLTSNTEVFYKDLSTFYKHNPNDILFIRDVESGAASELKNLEKKQKYYVFYYFNLDITGLTEVTFKLPGRVRYISQKGCELLDDGYTIKVITEKELAAVEGMEGLQWRDIAEKGYALFDAPSRIGFYIGVSMGGTIAFAAAVFIVLVFITGRRSDKAAIKK